MNKGYDFKHGLGIQRYDNNGDSIDTRNKTEYFRDIIVPIINKEVPTKHIALDVGCGNGRLSYGLSTVFDNVIAIDRINHFIKCPRNVLFLETDFDNLSMNLTADFIMFWGSFYMMNNYDECLRKCNTMLAENGIVMIADDKNRDISIPQTKEMVVTYHLDNLLKENNLIKAIEIIFNDYYRVTLIRHQH